jgi:hypothetical protein
MRKQSKRRAAATSGTPAHGGSASRHKQARRKPGRRTGGLRNGTKDITQLLGRTDIAMLSVDRECLVRSFTPTMRDLLAVSPSALGRHFRHIERHFEDPGLLADVQRPARPKS